jgi:hypothetical protein
MHHPPALRGLQRPRDPGKLLCEGLTDRLAAMPTAESSGCWQRTLPHGCGRYAPLSPTKSSLSRHAHASTHRKDELAPEMARLAQPMCVAGLGQASVISGARIAPASNSWAMRSRCRRARPTGGRRDFTSSRTGFGAWGPDAIKAPRPPGLRTAKDLCATSPPTVSKMALSYPATRFRRRDQTHHAVI